jgi:hypothetical protein
VLQTDVTAAAAHDEAAAPAGNIDCLAVGQTREGAALHQDESQLVAFHHDVEDGAAHAERARRGLDLIAGGLLDARDKTKRALGRAQHDLAGAGLRIENILVELDLGMWPDADACLITKQKLRVAVVAGADGVVLKQFAANRQGTRSAALDTFDLLVDGGCNADAIGGKQRGRLQQTSRDHHQ